MSVKDLILNEMRKIVAQPNLLMLLVAKKIVSYVADADPPLSSSDTSCYMSMCSHRFPDHEESELWEYPNSLPGAHILVVRIGWVSGREIARYLMMGYRVWNNLGSWGLYASTALAL